MMASAVPNIMALPIPCTTRHARSIAEETERPQRRQPSVYTAMPAVKILLRPYMSPSLPQGTRNTAAASRYEVATQLSRTASMENSFPKEGRATYMEERMKGMRKEARVATRRAVPLLTPLVAAAASPGCAGCGPLFGVSVIELAPVQPLGHTRPLLR